ncbi:hypothetical protein MferCBS31731_005321 [Microsporum ferrugineum]
MVIETSNFYSSPYLAELYELQWAGPHLTDVDLYAKELMDMVSKHRETASSRQFTFLELGTGSGRVILGVLKYLANAFFDTGNMQMIGLDNVQNMLDLAAKLESKTVGISPPVTWALGDALALDELPVLAGEHATVDLLLFPLSSIVHMVEDGQLEQLFQQIGKVLTPDTGRAYISLFNWFLIRPGDDLKARMDDEVLPPPTDVPSAQFRRIQYYSEMKKSECRGNHVIYHQDAQVFEKQDNGEKKEIECYRITQTLRWFSETAIEAAIEAAGLRIVERRVENIGLDEEGSNDFTENMFILQRV